MSREAKTLLFVRIGLCLVLTAVTILALGPFQGAEQSFGLTDKEAHFATFYGLTFMALAALPRIRKWDVAVAALAFGGLIEVLQTMTGRDGDILDWLADSFGIVMAVAPMYTEGFRMWTRGEARRPRRRRSERRQVEGRVPESRRLTSD
ncbi:MAG TPA: VanZ family protein [Asticcacaulis sp.]|nr:VanZ family protein [Asticcacaulis sp.]